MDIITGRDDDLSGRGRAADGRRARGGAGGVIYVRALPLAGGACASCLRPGCTERRWRAESPSPPPTAGPSSAATNKLTTIIVLGNRIESYHHRRTKHDGGDEQDQPAEEGVDDRRDASHANSTHGGVERILAARLSDQCERSGAAIVAGSNSVRTTGRFAGSASAPSGVCGGSWPPLHEIAATISAARRPATDTSQMPSCEIAGGAPKAWSRFSKKVGSKTSTPSKAMPTARRANCQSSRSSEAVVTVGIVRQ